MAGPRIGFIGLGLMGTAMCMRILDRGYPLTVLANRSRENVEKALARGASEATTARELATDSDIVMFCVDTSASVEARMLSEDGVIAGLNCGATIIDFGTSLPASTRMLGEKVAAAGGVYLDAPLGRTPAHAADGLLNIMCAGDRAGFDRVKPVLDDLGENVFYLGALGSGHTIKLINNFFGMTMATAMAEAFGMADAASVDRQALYNVMSAGPLHSSMMDFVAAKALKDDPDQLQFTIRNAAKDVGYYAQMASDAGSESMMSKCTREAFARALEAGYADRMVSEMVDFFSDEYRT